MHTIRRRYSCSGRSYPHNSSFSDSDYEFAGLVPSLVYLQENNLWSVEPYHSRPQSLIKDLDGSWVLEKVDINSGPEAEHERHDSGHEETDYPTACKVWDIRWLIHCVGCLSSNAGLYHVDQEKNERSTVAWHRIMDDARPRWRTTG